MSDPSFDPYAPPKADVNQVSVATGGKIPTSYFVFPPGWLAILATLTLGLFSIYWGYRQWIAVKRSGQKVFPLGRAIFLIFSVHALFRHIQVSRADSGLAEGRAQRGLATVFVILTICANLAGRSNAAAALLVFLALSLGAAWVLATAQKDINEVADRNGTFVNRGLGVGGIVIVVLGLVALVGTFAQLAS